MRAVVFDAVGSPLRVTELARPECPLDGAVIDVKATGICRSDWHAWRGHEVVPLPHVPGHEFSGVVTETGAQVSGFEVGDRVTVPFVNGCGRCDWCRAGQAQVCPHQTQPGFSHPGSFAEQVAIRAADFNLVRLPDSVDFPTAAVLGCRFATAFHALTAQARLKAEEWLAVFGCGGVGLSTIMIADALGARVVAVDPSPAALARAADLGAEATVAATDPVATVRSITGGGAHSSIDALGSAATAICSVQSLRPRGRHVQVGLMLGDNQLTPLPWEIVVSRELQVLGCHGMAASEYPAMLAMIADGRQQPQRLIGSVVDLERAAEILMAMDQPVTGQAGIVVATI
jgi:alcohol dehydrogenase